MRLDTYGKDDSFSNGMNIAICESNIAKYTETDYKSVYNGDTTQSEDDFIKGYLLGQGFDTRQPMIYEIEITEDDVGKSIPLCNLYGSFTLFSENNNANQNYYNEQSKNYEITKAVYLFGLMYGIQVNDVEITPETNPELFTEGDFEWETFIDSNNRTQYAITKIPLDVYRQHNADDFYLNVDNGNGDNISVKFNESWIGFSYARLKINGEYIPFKYKFINFTAPSAVYEKKGTYTITVVGNTPSIRISPYTTKVIQWGDIGLLTGAYLCAWCNKLTQLPDSPITGLHNCADFYDVFYGCESLKSVPENLFYLSPNAKNFVYAFSGCGLETIPQKLFSNNYEIKSVNRCFYDCRNLTAIPDELFKNHRKLIDAAYCFEYNSPIVSIGNSVFENCVSLTGGAGRIIYIMNNQTLKTVGDNLFKNCISLVESCYFFYTNRNLISIGSSTFEGCTNLRFISEFSYMNPRLVSVGDYIFKDCVNAGNIEYKEDTDYWYSAAALFYQNYSLQSVGKHIFQNCKRIKTLNQCFYQCYCLETLPTCEGMEDLTCLIEFAYNTISLTSIPENMFKGCYFDDDVPEGFFFSRYSTWNDAFYMDLDYALNSASGLLKDYGHELKYSIDNPPILQLPENMGIEHSLEKITDMSMAFFRRCVNGSTNTFLISGKVPEIWNLGYDGNGREEMFGYENGVYIDINGNKQLWVNDKIINYNDIPKDNDTYLWRINRS